jgi:hypothetical protein
MLRRQRSSFSPRLVFGEFGANSSFAVRYYQQSPQHQELLDQIERQAQNRREEKREEFRGLKEQYENLMRQQERLACGMITTFNEYWGRTETHHDRNCQKCRLKSQATSLSIAVHEWPLPSNALQAESAVFELLVPESFGHWRDATVYVLLDVMKMAYLSKRVPGYSHKLRQYSGLSAFMTPFTTTPRIELLSETKPHEVTHRKNRRISTSCEADVCLNNGLQYQYFDNTEGSFSCDFHETHRLPKLCTYKIPGKSPLQHFLFRPADSPSGPPPNTILANLHNCPNNMSLEEFKALCAIPLGYRTQWHNILVQLNAPTIDFKKLETELFLLQCIGQVGPRQEGTVLRSNHFILDNASFAEKLIDGIRRVSDNLKQNWQAAPAFGVFNFLATHLLSVCSHSHVRQKCLDFLELARGVTLDWTLQLKDRVRTT